MSQTAIYPLEKRNTNVNELAKKTGYIIFVLVQIPLITGFLEGELLNLTIGILTEIVLFISLLFIIKNKTQTATIITSYYLYIVASIIPYLFNVYNVSVPAITAIFVINNYFLKQKIFQKINLVFACVSLFVYVMSMVSYYSTTIEAITDMSICVISFFVMFFVVSSFRFDVTNYQMQLEKLNSLLIQITNTNPHFIYTTDNNNRLTFTNETMLNSLKGDIAGKNVNDFFKNATAVNDKNNIGTNNCNLKVVENKKGEIRFHELISKPLLDEDNLKIGTLGVSIDITTKRKAQIKLKQSEQKYKQLFENNQLAIVTAENGNFNSVNDTFCRMTGYTEDEIIGKEVSKIMHFEDYIATKYLVDKVENAETTGQSFEHRFIRKDDSIGYAIVNIYQPVDGSEAKQVLATLTDISNLKAAQFEVKKSETIYRKLIGNAFDGIEIHESTPPKRNNSDWQHLMLVRNNRIYDLLGKSNNTIKKESFSIKDILEMSPVYQRNGVKSDDFICQLIPEFQKNKIVRFEWRYGDNDQYIDTEMTLIRFKLHDKIYTTSIYKDITANKKAELTLKETNIKINLKNTELQKTLELNAALEQFAFMASHQLKEPLATILGFTKILKRSLKHKISNKESEQIDAILNTTSNMILLVKKLLFFARVNKETMEIKSWNFEELFMNIKQELHSLLEENDATLQLGQFKGEIQGDKLLIHQLLQNLITNAVKYSAPNRLPKIKITAQEDETALNFTVEDNGIGIKAKYCKTIFNLFGKVDSACLKGTGIGLAMCKKIVEAHKGKIWAESEPGIGSKFKFTISKNLE